MDVIYRLETATAADVLDNLTDPPSYSAVRTLLRILVEKGHLSFEQVGPRYVYQPVISAGDARRSAMDHVVATFFHGSVSQAVAALLGDRSADLTQEDLDRMADLIDHARKGLRLP